MANESQLSPLRPLTRHITTDSPSPSNTSTPSSTATIHSSTPLTWQSYDSAQMSFATIYTTSRQPPSLTNDEDIAAHERTVAHGNLGLVNPGGTVIRCVDFKPGYRCVMHRTRSLDYGIVVEGEVEAVVGEEGEGKKVERRKLGRGDVVVQRGTMHCWVNTSETEWARMMFVLMDCGKDGVEGGQDELVVLGKGESESGLGRK